jgi:hypothetical protein
LSYDVPSIEPEQIIVGETVKWDVSLDDYPNDTWSLTYNFNHTTAANNFNANAVAYGNDYRVTLTSAQTAVLTAGDYDWYMRVTDGSEVYYVENEDGTHRTGLTTVYSNPQSASTTRTLSHYKTVLDRLKAAIEGQATASVLSYSVAGRSLEHYSAAELMDLRDRYQTLYNQELAKVRAQKGLSTYNKVQVRFTEPT